MKIDFTTKLVGIKGEPILNNNPMVDIEKVLGLLQSGIPVATIVLELSKIPKKEPFFLKDVAIDSLMASTEADKNMKGTDKLKRGELAKKVYSSTEPIEVTSEEIVLIKEVINKMYGTEVVCAAYPLLEK